MQILFKKFTFPPPPPLLPIFNNSAAKNGEINNKRLTFGAVVKGHTKF